MLPIGAAVVYFDPEKHPSFTQIKYCNKAMAHLVSEWRVSQANLSNESAIVHSLFKEKIVR
jgi:hypothetical protein